MNNKIIQEYDIIDDMFILKESPYKYFKPLTKEEGTKYLTALYKKNSNRFRNVYLRSFFKCLQRGMEEESIILVLSTANYFRYTIKNMMSIALLPLSGFEAISQLIRWHRSEYNSLKIGGYYSPKENLIFAVISNPENPVLDKEKHLVYILHHELCHYASANKWEDFIRLFRTKYLEPYYTELFISLFRLTMSYDDDANRPIAKKMANVLLDYLLERERKYTKNTSTKNKDKKIILSCYDSLTHIDPMIARMWITFVIDSFEDKEYKDLAQDITREAYIKNNWKLEINFIHYQELVFPSEVIAVLASIYNEKPEFIEMLDILFN